MIVTDWKVSDQQVYEKQVGTETHWYWEQLESEPIKIQGPAKAGNLKIDFIHCEPKSWFSIFPWYNGKWMCHAIVRKGEP